MLSKGQNIEPKPLCEIRLGGKIMIATGGLSPRGEKMQELGKKAIFVKSGREA